jgi:uncharacterized membrane protein
MEVLRKIPSASALLARCAVLSTPVLLLSNLRWSSSQAHAWLSALPLALAGLAFALLQISLKPDRRTLAQRLLLAAAFIFWAIDQLLPPGRLATLIGDAVISAYVLDLFWMMQDQTESKRGDQQGYN